MQPVINNIIPQLTKKNRLKHLLTIESLTIDQIQKILDTAHSFFDQHNNIIKSNLLAGKILTNLFFEPSTRTRSTFDIAAKKLSLDVLNLNIQQSAVTKGESLLDTLTNLEAMQSDFIVVRHAASGTPELLAKHVTRGTHIINAGDGWHAHPTQALLDVFTISKHKPNFKQLTVALVGDIAHSRVARSLIQALKTLQIANIRLVAPKTLLPIYPESLGVDIYHDLKQGLSDADVVIMLRLQQERMTQSCIPSTREYFEHYGLNSEKLKFAKPDAIVLHPGPINREVEIDSEVAEGPQSCILEQVKNGIAIRMAILGILADAC